MMEKLQCSVCGGALVMSDDGEKAVCESCGMSFKKETVKKMIMELAGPVQVEGIQNSTSLAERAETFLRLGEMRKAEDAFRKLTDEYPADYRGWWGLTRLTDWHRYFYNNGLGDAAMPTACKRALEFAPEEAKGEIRAYFDKQVQFVKQETDRQLREEAAANQLEAERKKQAAEKQAELQRQQEEKAAVERQKAELYQQTLNAATARVEAAENQVSHLNWKIHSLPQQIKEEKKLTYNKRTKEDFRPITIANIIALALGGMLTYYAWEDFHPIGTPVLTLVGLVLPLLFITRRMLRTKARRTHAAELKRQLKQAEAERPKAEAELEQAQAALEAVRNAKPN